MTKIVSVCLAVFLLAGGAASANEELHGSYIVHFPTDKSSSGRDLVRSFEADGVRIAHTYSSGRMNLRGVTDEQKEALEGAGAVLQKDFAVQAQGSTVSWALDRLDQRFQPLDGEYIPMTQGSGVVHCLVDSGVSVTEDLAGKILPGGVNLVSREIYGPGDISDHNGHGTEMALLLVSGTFGVAPGARILPVRALGSDGSGWVSEILEGVDHCVAWRSNQGNPPMIINMSLGGPGSAIAPEMTAARAAGIMIVVSAGNFNDNTAGYWPVNDDNAFGVAATTADDRRVSPVVTGPGGWGSNFGSHVDVFAPGFDIPIVQTYTGGTSAAAALVSGVASLYLAEQPSLSPDQLENLIRQKATSGIVVDPQGSVNLLVYAPSSAPCVDTSTSLCLTQGRYNVQVSWATSTVSGSGVAIGMDDKGVTDGGLFWFFNERNPELLVKVLDACAFNNRFWVFFAATTNVEFWLLVTDTQTGEEWMYHNPLGVAAPPVQDTDAFATCDG